MDRSVSPALTGVDIVEREVGSDPPPHDDIEVVIAATQVVVAELLGLPLVHACSKLEISGGQATLPVTAVQPMSGGKQPAMPPHTMFCQVRRLSHMV